ncbi:unnamed protein product [Closterium sp. NIES-54]
MMAPESPSPLYLFYNTPLVSGGLSRSCRNSLPSQAPVQSSAIAALATGTKCAYPPHDFQDHRDSVAPQVAPRGTVSQHLDPHPTSIEPQPPSFAPGAAPSFMEAASFESFPVGLDTHMFADGDYGLGLLDDAFHGLETFTDLCDLPGQAAGEPSDVTDGSPSSQKLHSEPEGDADGGLLRVAGYCEQLREPHGVTNSSQHAGYPTHGASEAKPAMLPATLNSAMPILPPDASSSLPAQQHQQQDGWMALLAADLGLADEQPLGKGCADGGAESIDGEGVAASAVQCGGVQGGAEGGVVGIQGGVIAGDEEAYTESPNLGSLAQGGVGRIFPVCGGQEKADVGEGGGADWVGVANEGTLGGGGVDVLQLQHQEQQQSHESASVGWRGGSLNGSCLNGSSPHACFSGSDGEAMMQATVAGAEDGEGAEQQLHGQENLQEQYSYHSQGDQQQQPQTQQQLRPQQQPQWRVQQPLLQFSHAHAASPSPPAGEPAFPRWTSAPTVPAHSSGARREHHSSACPCGRCAPGARGGKCPARAHSAQISGAGPGGRAGAGSGAGVGGAVVAGSAVKAPAGYFSPKVGAASVGRTSPPKKRQQVLVVASAAANPGRRPRDLSQRLAAVIDRIAAADSLVDGGFSAGGDGDIPRAAAAAAAAAGAGAGGVGVVMGGPTSALSLWDRVRREGLSRISSSGTVSPAGTLAAPAVTASAALNADDGRSSGALQRAAAGGFRLGSVGGERGGEMVIGRGAGAGAAGAHHTRKGAARGVISGAGRVVGKGGTWNAGSVDGGAGELEPVALTETGKRALSLGGYWRGSGLLGEEEDEDEEDEEEEQEEEEEEADAVADAYSSGHAGAVVKRNNEKDVFGMLFNRGGDSDCDSYGNRRSNNNNSSSSGSDSLVSGISGKAAAAGVSSRALALPARRHFSSMTIGAHVVTTTTGTITTTNTGTNSPPAVPDEAAVLGSSALALLPSAAHRGLSKNDLFLRLAAGARTSSPSHANSPTALTFPSALTSPSASAASPSASASASPPRMHPSLPAAISATISASSPQRFSLATSMPIAIPAGAIQRAIYPEPIYIGCPLESRVGEAVVREAAGVWQHEPSLAPVSSTARLRTVDQLTALAEAYATDDLAKIRFLNRKLTKKADPMGDPLQRTVHYFLEALSARQEGRGLEIFRRPLDIPIEELSQAVLLLCRTVPFVHTCRTVIHEAILHALATEPVCTHLHIVGFGIFPGDNWMGLLHSLLDLPNGPPPRITLTAIDGPTSPGKIAMKAALADFWLKLEATAAALGLNFEFRRPGVRMETLRPGMVQRGGEPGEVVVVTCAMHMQFLPDVSVVRSNQRDSVLRVLEQVFQAAVSSPFLWLGEVGSDGDDFALVDIDANFNGPFFLSRFREAAMYFTNILACVDASGLPRSSPRRALFESSYLARDIVNVIACEGLDRMVRPERVEQWQARLERLGFFPRAVSPNLVDKILDLAPFRVGGKRRGIGGAGGFGGNRGEVGYDVKEKGHTVQITWNGERIMWAGLWCATPQMNGASCCPMVL